MAVKMQSGDYMPVGTIFDGGLRLQYVQDAMIVEAANFQGMEIDESDWNVVLGVTMRHYEPDPDETQMLSELADDAIDYLNSQISENNAVSFRFDRRDGDFLLLPESAWKEPSVA